MDENEKRLKELNASFEHNVFVMMRYRTDPKYKAIETTIRNTFSNYGLQARLAKDRAFYDDLWPNIVCYMKNSQYGLVVFEEMDEREYNPNISMELGYMYALGRRCLLLKNNRMPRLPTDICGKIYKDFDTYEIGVFRRICGLLLATIWRLKGEGVLVSVKTGLEGLRSMEIGGILSRINKYLTVFESKMPVKRAQDRE